SLGICLKSVTIMEGNRARGLPTVQGALLLFDEETGTPEAIIDSDLVTRWKTAADSGLGARFLARPDSRNLLIIGAGEVAASLAEVYAALFPDLKRIAIWNRTRATAETLVERLTEDGLPAYLCDDRETEAAKADIIACATMAREPVLLGDWVKPGTHVDLVGAFRPDMREADNALMGKARIFVDSRETTLPHIGELMIPISEGVITPNDICGDLYELTAGKAGRRDAREITVFKNGGGAHLDLMTARAILEAFQS
ncbi:MAG: ornithine cyclodeaminase, partial [Rhizobiales bacterium]|nr:ornithine cyclodeaminase [Hyphomicrobiales bacterium]